MELKTEVTIAQRYQQILDKMADLATGMGRQPELLAVSKGQQLEKIKEVYALGQRRFGENYAQELIDKAKSLETLDIEWVYIGHLQSNKIKKIVSVASEIQTLSELRHAELIAKAAVSFGKVPFPVYVEVNAGLEVTKTGISLRETINFTDELVQRFPELSVQGIMAIPPSTFQDETSVEVPELYYELRRLADKVGRGKLSLGMSGDMRISINAGSDTIRIGTALFGSRAR
jgi:pyridoxal phosphate enzyme (YggS family)